MDYWVKYNERDSFEKKKTVTNQWERNNERENYCDFHIHKLSCWIGKKYLKRDKCFALFVICFGILSFCLYCTNWGFILIWLFVSYFFLTTCIFYSCMEGFFILNKLCLYFFLIFILRSILYWCSSHVLISLEEFISLL